MTYTIAELIANLGDMVTNVADITPIEQRITIAGIAPIDKAQSNQLAFLANSRHSHALATTRAGVILISQEMLPHCPVGSVPLVVASPYLAYAKLTALFAYQSTIKQIDETQIHPTAIIADTAIIGQGVRIGAFCVIGEAVNIGDGTQIDHHVTLEDGVRLGQHCLLKSNVFVGHHCQLGDFVTLHSHASIGNEGFGFAPRGQLDTAGWQKIHQLGGVVIGNHVRIGSQTCIDRGALEDTVIEDNVIIDNLVQIAHNVHIGAGTAIAAGSGIAGSTHIGKRCVIAGMVGIIGHLTITDDVTFTGMTMVTKSLSTAGSYSSGMPLMTTPEWRRSVVKFRQLASKSSIEGETSSSS